MPASNTYEPIATTTLTSAVPSVTFGSIPQTYTDLILVASGSSSGNTGVTMQFNSDTGTNYSATFLEGSGTSAVSERQSSVSGIRVAWNSLWDSSTISNIIINIQNYSNTTTNKTSIIRSNNSARYTELNVGLWRSTAAITSVVLSGSSANFASGATFTLYGIKAA
jgi:hypothetical protein